MLRLASRLSRPSILGLGLGVLALQASVQGQVDAHAEHRHESRAGQAAPLIDLRRASACTSTVFVGRALNPDGAPAAGAVVVTSAGGRAVVGADGNFSLGVNVPAEAESVRVTAVLGAGAGSLVASAQVGGLARGGTTSAGTLFLEQSTTCQPNWLPTFGGEPGINNNVHVLAVFDDGSGPAIFAAGEFTAAGGVPALNIARWNGTSWTALGSGLGGMPDDYVNALAVFDDGGGPALYAGGLFATAGDVAVNNVAKWNGSSWSALGEGTDDAVRALTVFDDGGGPALYAGGFFTTAGDAGLVNFIARWNGSNWSTVGGGMDTWVSALTAFDDGSGPTLIAGGFFTLAGGVPAKMIAKWNGSSWSALGSGMNAQVLALTALDDGSGPALYAGGLFTTAGGVAAKLVAKWNGTAWSALGSGIGGSVTSSVNALSVFDDGTGPALHAGGFFTTAGGLTVNSIARWNGTTWSALGSGMDNGVFSLTVFDAGNGPALYAGGVFLTADDVAATRIATWNGTSWSALGTGMNERVQAVAVFDDGSGPALYAGGFFTTASGVVMKRIAKWNGSSWSALGGGMDGGVLALAVFDDGGGPALYTGGEFHSAGGVPADFIAKWNGSTWSAVGGGVGGGGAFVPSVAALVVFDDGNGPALYAGGFFTTAGGAPASRIAKWDGATWSALGSGISGSVSALAVFDDGGGPALYAGGQFTNSGTVTLNSIGRWNGTSWSALGSGMDDGDVSALAAFDDGGGPALYAGGTFTTSAALPLNGIGRWNGTTWSALGSGMNNAVSALAVFDDGSGPSLCAGGLFTTAGGATARSIAQWDGSRWLALGSGMDGGVLALQAFDDGSGAALYAGGAFSSALDSRDSYLARWSCPSPPVWIDLGFALPGSAGAPHLMGTGTLVVGTPMSLDLSGAAPSAFTMLFVSLSSAPLPFKGGTLVPVPSVLELALMTSASGEILIPLAAWPAGVSGMSLYLQYAIQDQGAMLRVALSNALRADAP